MVIVNTILLTIFVFSFAQRPARRDWRSLAALSAFIVALFTEMYGFPLTVYLLSAWLASGYSETDPFTYSAGQLWQNLLGDAYLVYLFSYLVVAGGFVLVALSWRVLYDAQRIHRLATTGPYSWLRHPQYIGFILIMFGMLLAWPTSSTLIMFLVLLVVYIHLARSEEQEALATFGEEYRQYMLITPAFLPRLGRAAH